MKFLVSSFLLATVVLSMDMGGMGGMGGMVGGMDMMMEEPDAFMQHFLAVVEKMMENKMMEKMYQEPKPDKEKLFKQKMCYGQQFSDKMEMAMTTCTASCGMMDMGGMGDMMGGMDMGMPMEGDMMGGMMGDMGQMGGDMMGQMGDMMGGDMMGQMGDMMGGDMMGQIQDMMGQMMGGGDMGQFQNMMGGQMGAAGRSMETMETMEDCDMKEMMKKMMLMKLVEFKKCFLGEMGMGWTDESCSPVRCAVQEDLASTAFAERIQSVEGRCWNASRMIDEEGIMQMMMGQGDIMMDMEMNMATAAGGMYMGGAGRSLDRQGKAKKNKKNKSKKDKKNKKNKNKKNKNKPEPEGLPELSDEEKAAVMEAIRSVAYFECVHESVESACEAKGEEIMQGMCDKEEDFLSGWNLSVEALDNLGGEIPKPLLVYFPESGLAAKPGQVVFTENMAEPPMSHWEADPDALYTYLIEDNSLNNDARYTHYMVSNIPGSNMEYGEDVFCYIPSFSFFRPEQEDGSLGDSYEFKVGQHHEHLHLVYRQNGPVDFQADNIGECGCDETDAILNNRYGGANYGMRHELLEEQYGMTLVAGSVIFNPYSPATLATICQINAYCALDDFANFPFAQEGTTTGDLFCLTGEYEGPEYLQFEAPILG